MSSGAIIVIVIVAIIAVAAVIVLSLRASRRRAAARHHIGLPDLGSLSKASERTDGGVQHTKVDGSEPSPQRQGSQGIS
jgi:hypothetical protein